MRRTLPLRGIVLVARSKIRRLDFVAGGGQAPLGRDAAAVGPGRDDAIRADGHDAEVMAAQLADQRRQAGPKPRRWGDGLPVHTEKEIVREVGRVAGIGIMVARGYDENGLLARAFLGEGGDPQRVFVPEFLPAVLLDDADNRFAHIEKVDGPTVLRPGGRRLHPGRPLLVGGEGRRRVVRDRGRAGRGVQDEHRDIGAPGDAVRGILGPGILVARLARGDARDSRAVGSMRALLGGRLRAVASEQEYLRHRLSGEERVSGIDSAFEEADGLAGARITVGAVEQPEPRPGVIRADLLESRLVGEGFLALIGVRDKVRLPDEFGRCQAAELVCLDTARPSPRNRRPPPPHADMSAAASVGTAAQAGRRQRRRHPVPAGRTFPDRNRPPRPGCRANAHAARRCPSAYALST